MIGSTAEGAGPDAAPATGRPRRLGALDGLRGLALIGMLAWHAEVGWVRGGFARMTIFFVLAGYLAAASLRRSGEVGHRRPFAAFWGRRPRRLLPITVLGVGWAVLVTALVGSPTARAGLTGDTAATLFSFENWRFIAQERSYGALFESGSAFEHYWSLSLEEQAFIVLPLLMAAAVWLARGRRGTRTALVLLVGGVAAGLSPALVHQAPDTVYYGTHTRIGEFLVGVALAELVAARPVASWTDRTRRLVGTSGAAGLAALVATMLFVERDHAWLYEGGLILFAFPAVAVIAAALAGSRVVTTALAVAPLEALGRWALPVYVLHWPLYQLMGDGRVGLHGDALVVAQLAASIAGGWVLHRLVERPLMRSPTWGPGAVRPDADRRAPGAARRPLLGLAAASVALVAVTLPVPRTEPEVDFDTAAERIGSIEVEAAAAIVADPLLDPHEAAELIEAMGGTVPFVFRQPELPGVALYGGSSALTLGMGAGGWVDRYRDVQALPGYGGLGCGLVVKGLRRNDDSSIRAHEGPAPEHCHALEITWPASAAMLTVDVPVVVASTWDLDSFLLDGGSGSWTHLGEVELERHLREVLHDLVEGFARMGTSQVVFLTMPPPVPDVDAEEADRHDRRARVYDAIIGALAERRDDVVVLDFGGWLRSQTVERRAHLLPDGVHPTGVGAEDVWAEFLGPGLEAEVDLVTVARIADLAS